MQQQFDNHIFTGMQRDLSISKHPANYLFDAQNIRITARDGNTLLSITNERGPKDLNVQVSGTYLGHCILNQYLVVFSTTSTARSANGGTSGKDYITRIDLDTEVTKDKVKVLYDSTRGNLGFCTVNPIEAISSYENANIQKVYWTDGYNQPRLINISKEEDYKINKYKSLSFDFVQELKLEEQVDVVKLIGSGEFPPGVIQYAFTYFNKHGQESNIFYTTPLYYISYKDRGGSPEGKIANAFRITISNPDTNFEFIRVYSILRTSINGTPVVRKVQDVEVIEDEGEISGSQSRYNNGLGTLSQEAYMQFSDNGGASFIALTSNKMHLYTDSDCPKPSYSRNLDRTYWGEMAHSAAATPAHVYKFTKSEFPNLMLKIADKYYTWASNSADDAVIYLGLASHINVLVSENAAGEYGSNVDSYSRLASPIQCIDDGTIGEDVDPTELLYKGGESIKAQTIEQKDGTLFFGNIEVTRPPINIKDDILNANKVTKASPLANSNVTAVRCNRPYLLASSGPFAYISTLTGPETEHYQGAQAFKSGEYYRLGVQFQYKNGRWSEPCWIGDKQCTVSPLIDEEGNNKNYSTKGIGVMAMPEFRYSLSASLVSKLTTQGYKKARPVYAISRVSDRTILCQGVGCPTIYRKVDRWSDAKDSGNGMWTGTQLGTLYAQSSLLFRTLCPSVNYAGGSTNYNASSGGGKVTPNNRLESQYDNEFILSESTPVVDSPYLRSTEVMGKYDDGHAFYIDSQFITLHSPDIIFDDMFAYMDFKGVTVRNVGYVSLSNTYGDIDIQTSSPAIGSDSGEFTHRSIKTDGYAALISGLFYNDYLVDDTTNTPTYGAYNVSSPPIDWPIYMWHKNGSLNNDVSRGGRSAELMKKKISNYRLGGSTTYVSTFGDSERASLGALDVQLFNSDQLAIVKVAGCIYKGNIDSMVTPTTPSAYYLVGDPWRTAVNTGFESPSHYKLQLKDPNISTSKNGVWVWECRDDKWNWYTDNRQRDDIGDYVKGLCQWREGVSIKYKSTPHLVAKLSKSVYRYHNGKILDNGQLPLLEITRPYEVNTIFGGTSDDALQANIWIPCGPTVALKSTSVSLQYKWGDSYLQRYECLKTYPFTQEDKNQVVEIASFICESRVNIDGRYDRNRGQTSNLNMSPVNFNLLNPVYSQQDNFFTYRILDEDFYRINSFPNQITWTKEKQAGADVDLWTNITLASTYDMDGSKGQVQSLNTWKDQLYCFQDKGISNILFNSRVQIPTSDGVPIEITNSYKVDGYRYITDGTGCTNKYTIKETATGIYFIDSVTNNLYHIGEGVSDIATTHNMATWFRNNEVLKTVYDDVNHDVYLIGQNDALCYSEVMKEFTSRMSYEGVSLLESYGNSIFTMHNSKLYEFGTGEYNMFFGTFRPWLIDFISNGVSNQANNSTLDKVFDNLEYRMDRYSKDATTGIWKNEHQKTLDYIRVFNEYQDTGYVDLSLTIDRASSISNLKKKFRVWRVNIPRNKVIKDNDSTYKTTGKRDRIRNTWCNIELGIKEENTDKVEMHDMNVIYYM